MHLTVNFHHDGNFVPSPLMYQEGEKSTIRDLEFEGMTVIRLSKLLQGTCMFPVKGYKNGKTDIDNNDDELSDVEMEDITGYGVSDFVGEDDSDGGESSQPSAKEVEIDSDDEDVDKNFKLVDGVIYLEFDPKLPWNEMKPTLGLRFKHPEQLKECMTNYGVANGYLFRPNAGQIAGKQNGYNAVQNVVQNLGIQNVKNHNRLSIVLGIAN
ncbi:hypothetical protein Tco_1401320 [Tanacetum coccineum]